MATHDLRTVGVSPPGVSGAAPRFATCFLAAIAALSAAGPGGAQPAVPARPDYTIHLLNGTLGPDFPAFPVARASLGATTQTAAGQEKVHVLVQFDRVPAAADRADLGRSDITLHEYISNYAWVASLPEAALAGLANRPGVRFLKRWEAVDKLHPRVAAGQIGPWARDAGTGMVNLIVAAHGDVALDAVKPLIEQAGGIAVHAFEAEHSWSAWLPEAGAQMLAQDERIYWVEEVSPPLDNMNDGARADLYVNPLQDPPAGYNLFGAGVNVFVFDGGTARISHQQLAGHSSLVTGEQADDQNHPTHVATTVAGNGTGDARAKGMAPQAWILTSEFEQTLGSVLFFDSYGDMITDYSAARNDASHPADLATNSIGANLAQNGYDCALEGAYGLSSRMIDRIARGDETGIAGSYRRYIVTWAAGNERGGGTPYGRCGGGYLTLPPPASAKNPISVGATYSDYDATTEFSSWGPTASGRLKPIVVGPGCEIMGEGAIYSAVACSVETCTPLNVSNTGYGLMCGTSMATPAVAGVVALVLEQYHTSTGTTAEPWNAAVKALLAHTAKDLGPIGPDYMTGYGRVDAKAAIDLLRADAASDPSKVFHDVTREAPSEVAHGQTLLWTVVVPAMTAELKATLAWDDPASALPSTGTIVNDLDLELLAPDGSTVHYPWVLNAASPWLAATTGVNSADNQEQVVVSAPTPGTWTVRVKGTAVPSGPQAFGLVYSYTASPTHTCANEIDYSPATRNGGFESPASAGDWTLVNGAARVASASHTGGYSLELSPARNTREWAYQLVTIPANVSRAMLSYWWRCVTTDLYSGNDWLVVDVRDTAGTLLAIVDLYTNGVMLLGSGSIDPNPRWAQTGNVDLLPWKGQTVQLWFRAGNSDDTSLTTFWVDDVRLEACTIPAGCTRPSGLTGMGAVDRDPCQDTGVEVSWTDVTDWGDGGSGTRSYAIDRSTDGVSWTPAGTDPDLASPFVDSGGTNGVAYRYRVVATNGCGVSAQAEATGTATDATVCSCFNPPSFAGLGSVSQLPVGATCGLRLEWAAGTSQCTGGPGLTYTVYRRDPSHPSWAPVGTCLTGLVWDDTGVTAGTTYDYMVRAEDSTNASTGLCNHGNQDANSAVRSGGLALASETATQQTTPLSASNGLATSTLTPPVTLTTPYSATLSYVLQHTPTNVSETTVIQPSVADTFVDQANPAQNYGSGLTMDVQRGSVRRSLVRFDFSLIPSGATITAATLELYATAVPGTSRNLAVHRITAAWVEGSATWTSFAGAFETAAAATIAGGTSTGWKTWTVTSLVRALFEGTYANHGFLVKASSETGSGTYSFATRENATTGNRPILRVTYTIPGTTTRSQVALVGPTSAVTVLKAYGVADAGTYDVLPYYTGPGSYSIRVSETGGGTAQITNATMVVKDATCTPAPVDNVQFLTARATGGHVKLEWQNPAANFGSTRVCWSTAAYPTDPVACSALTVDVMGGAGGYGTAGHDTANGVPVYYTAFVDNGSGTYSSGKRVRATPFATTGAAKWAYSTGASSLAPPGLEWGGAYYAVSNDRALHAMNGAPAGGDWPRTSPDDWLPQAMTAPVQHQPPVVPLGATTYVYLASQDGYAYAFDAGSGARLWTSNDGTDPLQLGTMLQADPVGLFAHYGATTVDRLFVGTRNGTGENLVHALDPATGTVAYTYGAGQGIGIITGMSADYANRRVYFASRALAGGSSNTLWCLDVTSTGASLHRAWALGDIDGTPVAYGGRVYVGDNAGEVTCVDPESNTLAWTYATGDGPVKGYVYPDFATPLRLYFSTSTKVHALEANGAAVTSPAGWPVTTIAAPTTPQLLFDSGHLLTGSSNGSLYQVSLSNPASVTSVPLGSGQLGAVAVDTSDPANVIAIVGSTAGVVYAVRVPL